MWGFYFDIETNELISNPYELGEQCSPRFTEELFLNHHPSFNLGELRIQQSLRPQTPPLNCEHGIKQSQTEWQVPLGDPMCPARFKQSPYDISCMNSSMYYVGVGLVLLCLLNL